MRSLTLASFLFASTAFAGVTYDFQSMTTGAQQRALTGTVSVEGRNIRFDVTHGDNLLFKDTTFVLSNDGGQTLNVFDPAQKTYYTMNLSALSGSASGLFKSLGGVNVSVANPKVSVRDLGDASAIAGYPTRHSTVDAAYDINIEAMGTKIATHMDMATESWTTDRIGSEFMNFIQMKNLRTGFDQLDKLIDAQSETLRGRFPLKQVTTLRLQQGSGDITTTTTSEVTHIEKKDIAASTFAAPNGYTKVDDPITRMTKNLK